MTNVLQFIADHSMTVVVCILLFFGLIEAIFGYLAKSNRTKDDLLIEVVNTFVLFVITKPLIMILAFEMMHYIFPKMQDLVKTWNIGLMLLVFLLVDDFLQYWYHRSSHEIKWLWKWHRAHHSAKEMGLLVSYREAVYFFIFMPNVWWLGIFTYLGGGIGVLSGLVFKQIIVISSHSLVTWDSFFYKRPKLKPVMKLIERIVITPAFHHAHHAVSIVDGIGHPNGNFGNMFSIWDQLFGSAKFTRSFPSAYGIPNDPNDSWASQTFYPLVKSSVEGSELSNKYSFEKTTVLEPAKILLKEGEYLYCKCGYSKTQPFCDGSHHGTKYQPQKFAIHTEKEYKLCRCGLTQSGPFCDNAHAKV